MTTVMQPTLPTPAPEAKPGQIDKPGIYDLPEDAYHADPVPGGSLSCSSAKLLLRPSCPAKFKYTRDHGQKPKRAFDLGHAAHKLVLGKGAELVIITADNYKTKAAQEKYAAAHTAGHTPLLERELAQAEAMAKVIRAHPRASVLLDPNHGHAEQSLFWADPSTGVRCRARLDWLPDHTPGVKMTIPDYKTCASANPDELQRVIDQRGYNQQAAWYQEGIRAVGYAPDAEFVFIFQEKEPPYVVTVAVCDPFSLEVGAFLNREARFVYRRCVDTGVWPGYSDDIEMISLPPWRERQFDKTNFS